MAEPTRLDPQELADNALASITPSPMRRGVAVAIVFCLGAILVYMALAVPPASIPWRFFQLGLGIGALWLAQKLYQATGDGVILTNGGLYESSGREICRMKDISGVDRGAFAFKPSNGFLLHVRTPARRGWAPGLWWRFGRKIGVGGVTPAAEARLMAEMIAISTEQQSSSD